MINLYTPIDFLLDEEVNLYHSANFQKGKDKIIHTQNHKPLLFKLII